MLEKTAIVPAALSATKGVGTIVAGAGATILSGPVGVGTAICISAVGICKGVSWIIAAARDPNPKHNDDLNVNVNFNV